MKEQEKALRNANPKQSYPEMLLEEAFTEQKKQEELLVLAVAEKLYNEDNALYGFHIPWSNISKHRLNYYTNLATKAIGVVIAWKY